MFGVVLLTLAFLCIACNATNIRTCENIPPPLSVTVPDCEDPPCVVYRGQFAVMDVHFLGDKNNISGITTKVSARVFGQNVPYTLTEDVSNVCSNLLYGAMCPIYRDEDVTYRFNFFVEPVFPTITTDVTVKLFDEHDEPITCFVIACRIRKALSSLSENAL